MKMAKVGGKKGLSGTLTSKRGSGRGTCDHKDSRFAEIGEKPKAGLNPQAGRKKTGGGGKTSLGLERRKKRVATRVKRTGCGHRGKTRAATTHVGFSQEATRCGKSKVIQVEKWAAGGKTCWPGAHKKGKSALKHHCRGLVV